MAQVGDKGIHVLLETESWRFVSEKATFGIYNFDPSDNAKNFVFKLTEIKEEDLLTEELKPRYQLYETLFANVDAGTIS